jgi:chromosome segregation ATPase
VLGGASKYLINGHRAQQQSIQNLFQSVQLNINNPNFMIAQGKVMQVLNMKAKEILAMLEEAAGTRMFEDRRDKAYKTMAKKEMKVQELRASSNASQSSSLRTTTPDIMSGCSSLRTTWARRSKGPSISKRRPCA